MSWTELQDWIAVCRADEIISRLDFQNDLAYARGFDRQGAVEARRERRLLVQRYRDLMVAHAGEDARAVSTWNSIRSGTF